MPLEMSGTMSQKRAARIERRKAKVAAIFGIGEQVIAEKPTEKEGEMVEENEGDENEPVAKKPRLSDEEYLKLRKEMREKKNILKSSPHFRLVHCGLNASLNVSPKVREPISVTDVQTLMIYSLVGTDASYQPYRWCQLSKWNNLVQTLILAVDNVSAADFSENTDCFPETRQLFEDVVEVCNPRSDGYSLAPALAYTSVSLATQRRVQNAYGSLKKAADDGFLFGPEKMFNSTEKKPADDEEQLKTPCSKFDLLLSHSQLISEHFPFPDSDADFEDFVFTKDEYAPVTETSPMFSIDCEWVTCEDGSNGLARVAIVDEQLQTVYHTFVKPDKPIADYQTRYSGITEEGLEGVTKTPSDVQQDLRKLLPPDAIIVGQSVNCDLKTLKMFHPYIIDTSFIYNLTGIGHCKTRLKILTHTFCKRVIQNAGKDGHNPVEDALAAMELVLLKLENGVSYGDVRRGYGAHRTERDTINRSYEQEFDARNESRTSRKKNGSEDDESEFDHNSLIHIKLFSYIQCLNKGATLITTQPETEKVYRPKLMTLKKELIKLKDKKDAMVGPVRCLSAKDLPSIVQAVKDTRFDSNFTLIHTEIEKMEEETARKKKWKQLDQSIADIYKQIPVKGMMVVVFGGSEGDTSQNGACLVRINKPDSRLFQ